MRTKLSVLLCGKEDDLTKRITKKATAFLLAAVIMITSAAFGKTDVSAQHGQARCPGISTCYGCKASNCQVYKVQKINVTFSYKQCKTIVDRAKKINSFASYASMIVGVKKSAAGVALSLYGTSVENSVKMFKTAVKKKKGLKLSYEYVINKRSYSLNKYRKVKQQYV